MRGPGHIAAEVAKRLLSVALSIILTLGMLEVAFRVFKLKKLFIPAGIQHTHFHHRLPPNQPQHYESDEFDVTIQTNRYGLRGPDPVLPKPAGRTRILMMGDSFTFGFPVRDEETFSAIVERRLTDQGLPVDIVNGGVSGYAPTLHYVSLRDQFLEFQPDAVILWFDFGDIQEDAWFQKNVIRDASGGIVRVDPRYRDGRFDWWEWTKQHSVLAKYLDTKLLRTWAKVRTLGLKGYIEAKRRGERSKVAIARLNAEKRSADLASSDRFLLVRDSLTAEQVRPYWDVTAQYLRMIHALCRERGIPLFIGLYPYGMIAGPDQWAEGRTAWGFEQGRTYEPGTAVELLGGFCAKEGIRFVNTIGSFRAAAASEKLYYDWDGHFTPAGHRVLAEHLLRDPQFQAVLPQASSR